jgi:transposase-like protein
VQVVISDDHLGLRKAIREVLSEALWQRCYVHFLRNALDYLPRKADDDCLMELRWIYERRNREEARQDLSAWLVKWSDQQTCGNTLLVDIQSTTSGINDTHYLSLEATESWTPK